MISTLEFGWQQNQMFTQCELQWKIVIEMGPCSLKGKRDTFVNTQGKLQYNL